MIAPSLHVIAITGCARTGKDACSKILVAQGYHRLALADGVRSAFADLSGPTWDLHKELSDSTVNIRRAQQLLGTEARLTIDSPELWIDLLLVKVVYAALYHPVSRTRFVVPDVRYKQEVERLRFAITQLGGTFEAWRVERPGMGLIAESSHSSEQGIDLIPVDRVIVNDGTLADLATKVCPRENRDER